MTHEIGKTQKQIGRLTNRLLRDMQKLSNLHENVIEQLRAVNQTIRQSEPFRPPQKLAKGAELASQPSKNQKS